MTFTIVHIAIAFTLGYVFGALGMWMVQRIRGQSDLSNDLIYDSDTQKHTTDEKQFEGLGDEADERTRIQTRPHLAIAKAPPPADFSALESETQDSLELVEALPEAPDREDTEDTEDIIEPAFPVDPPTELTDEPILEDILGTDDTLPFVRPPSRRLKL